MNILGFTPKAVLPWVMMMWLPLLSAQPVLAQTPAVSGQFPATQAEAPVASVQLNPTDELRAQYLEGELRCPTCQGLSVKDSEASFSRNIRDKVRSMVAEGKSNDEILAYFEARYGEFILRSPKKSGFGLLAWLLPIGGVLLAGGVMLWRLKKAQDAKLSPAEVAHLSPTGPSTTNTSAEGRSRLERDLKRFEED